MKEKTKNIISVVLPVMSIFVIAFAFKTGLTGFAVYENKTLYRLNGSISIDLQDKIPVDSYIRVKIDEYAININLIDFLKKSGNVYRTIKEGDEEFIVGDGSYAVSFDALGIVEGFEKGKHVIIVDIVHKDSAIYSNEKIVEI